MRRKRDPKLQAFIDGIRRRAEHINSLKSFRRKHKEIMAEEHEENTSGEKKEAPDEEA